MLHGDAETPWIQARKLLALRVTPLRTPKTSSQFRDAPPYCNQCQTVRSVKMESEFHYRVYRCTLGAFAKLREATISFVVSLPVCPHEEQPGSHRTDCHEICYQVRLENLLRKF